MITGATITTAESSSPGRRNQKYPREPRRRRAPGRWAGAWPATAPARLLVETVNSLADLRDVVLVGLRDLVQEGVGALRPVDELLHAGHQGVVVPGRRPVRIEGQAVLLAELVEVRDQLLVLRVGDLADVGVDGHATGIPQEVLDVRLHCHVEDVVGQALVL